MARITSDDILDEIFEYFEKNNDKLIECIEELDKIEGFLGDQGYCEMSNLDKEFEGLTPTEIIKKLSRCCDLDDMYIDKGIAFHKPFNINRKYYKKDSNGNLLSTNEKDYYCWIYECINEIDAYKNEMEFTKNNKEVLDMIDEYYDLKRKGW